LLLTEGEGGLKDWPVFWGFFVFGLPITYAATLVFGLPYVLWLRARGKLTFPLVCLGASLAGAFLPFWRLFAQPHLSTRNPCRRLGSGFGSGVRRGLLHRGRHNNSSKRTAFSRRLTQALASNL
jgi:hypothetical protein